MCKYSDYSAEQFIIDDYFVSSILQPTEESDMFWNGLLEGGIIDRQSFDEARNLIVNLSESSDIDISDERLERIWEKIQKTNNKNRKRKIYFRYASAAAACIIFVLISIFFYKDQNKVFDAQLSVEITFEIDSDFMASDKIQLVTSDNTIDVNGDEAVIDHSQKGSVKINDEVLSEKERDNEQLVYNHLLVPYGKRTSMILSDGSRIWVNAGTRVKYPVEFPNSTREIYVDGEIFAEIAKDSKRPFVIHSRHITTEVLGTTLNVSSYDRYEEHTVVLVSGAVKVKAGTGAERVLKPSEMFYASNNQNYVKTVDVSNYISWKDGSYRFRNESLTLIFSRLEKYYGVDIECPQSLANITCSGSLDLKDDIKRVLDGLCQTAPIGYTKSNNTYKFIVKPN